MPKINIFYILTVSLIVWFLSFFILVARTDAADVSLYLSPSSGTYIVGSTFSVMVKVDSEAKVINAAGGTLVFDPEKLRVVSISKSNSIFSLWINEPTFSNSTGTINFGGGTPETFIGSSGTILTINFYAKNTGTGNVNFSSGSVLAADFEGTDVLTGMGSGTYIIQTEIIPPANAPAAPIISSPTHPDSQKWYSNNDPKFVWEVLQDVNGLKLLADHKPTTIPTVFYSPVLSEKQLKDLADGIWYFHAQLRNEFGWGGISHFKFQIDTQPPNSFEIKVKEGQETTNSQPTLLFETTDETSGIDYFGVKIDKENPIKVEKPEYKLPPQTLGKHVILVNAIDKAGNGTLSMLEIKILPSETPITISMTTLLVLIGVAISGSILIWIKIKQKRKKLRKEITEADKALYQAFEVLRKEIEKQVAELDKQPGLNENEKKIYYNLKKTLKLSQKFVSKEIKDIEKELK